MRFRRMPKNPRQIWSVSSRVMLAVAALFGVFSLAFWLTRSLSLWQGWHLGLYPFQMTTLGIALILLVIGGMTTSRYVTPRQHAFWQSLLDALRHMTKGDFNVRLDVDMIREPGGEEHPFRILVHSINDMAQELGQLEKMRQEFVSNVSHEIQSPLTSIQGFAAALRTGDLSDEQANRYLAIIETESKRLSKLSDNLLKLTSLESGYHPYHRESYRLDSQIRSTVLVFEPTWIDKKINVDLALPAVEVFADLDLMRHVWINIISNAVKFTPEYGTITISAKVTDRWVVVRITDTGIGMHPEELARIFERFYKADKARSDRVAGAGLGLSIVKKIIDLHGGRVQVESAPGAGSTFTVSLPISSH